MLLNSICLLQGRRALYEFFKSLPQWFKEELFSQSATDFNICREMGIGRIFSKKYI